MMKKWKTWSLKDKRLRLFYDYVPLDHTLLVNQWALTDGGIIGRNKKGEVKEGYFSSLFFDGEKCYHLERVRLVCSSNNESEYSAVIDTMVAIVDHYNFDRINMPKGIVIYTDSELVINQINNKWRVKAENLINFYKAAHQLSNEWRFKLTWVSGKIVKEVLGH